MKTTIAIFVLSFAAVLAWPVFAAYVLHLPVEIIMPTAALGGLLGAVPCIWRVHQLMLPLTHRKRP